ncbi:MAG: hypothetical protein M3Z84_05855 [Actinomycetota bacterium]|nr:hypothetical protein [Actinomycetota bacterium]
MHEVSAAELDESGLAEITGPAFVIRLNNGVLAAACGFRLWPDGVAHFCVLTYPAHRRVGHATAVAAAAIQ